MFSIPSLENYVVSFYINYENIKNLHANIAIFSGNKSGLIKYNILSQQINFSEGTAIHLTSSVVGKSFKELIGVNTKQECFIGLEFLNDMKEKTGRNVTFILKYI